MNSQEMRNYVAGLYKGPRWARRVSLMSDGQVFAIYQAKQKLDEEKKEKEKKDDIPF